MGCLGPVLRTESDRFLKVAEGIFRIALESINSSKGVMNVFLAGDQLIRLVEIFKGLIEVTAVECRNSASVASLRRLGMPFLVPLAFTEA